jgi:hypothetical protein
VLEYSRGERRGEVSKGRAAEMNRRMTTRRMEDYGDEGMDDKR